MCYEEEMVLRATNGLAFVMMRVRGRVSGMQKVDHLSQCSVVKPSRFANNLKNLQVPAL